MSVNLKALIGKLNATARKALEDAAKIAEAAKEEEWSDGGKSCTVWDLSKEGIAIAKQIRALKQSASDGAEGDSEKGD